ncbi:hypothetical protein RAHE111665_02540 [Rariglobus hedericola]
MSFLQRALLGRIGGFRKWADFHFIDQALRNSEPMPNVDIGQDCPRQVANNLMNID